MRPVTDRPAGRVDGWELVELLGQGAMGTVWRARHVATGRPAALKLVRAGPDRGARLAREAALAARLDHPGVVRVLAASAPDAPTPWVAFELLERATPLGQVWAGFDRLQRLALLRDVARAVGHAHARGVVHRDLKPDNVLVDAAGLPRVADFGLAVAEDVERLTRTGVLVGTPLYMAPEQASGQRGAVGPWTDVWALGVMLHEALVDRPPFEGHGGFIELARLITTTRPAGPRALDPTVSPALDALVLSCLALESGERPQDGEAVAAALDRLLAGPASRPGQGRQARAGARRRRRLLAALGLPLVGVGLVGVGLAVGARRPPAPPAADPPASSAAAPLPGLALVPAQGHAAHLVPASLDALVAGPEPGWLDGLVFEVVPKAGLAGASAVRRLSIVRTTDHGATWSRLAALDYPPGTSCVGATLLRAPDGRLVVVAGQTVDRPVRVGVEWGEVDVARGTIGPLRPIFEAPAMTFTPHAAFDREGRLVVATLRHDGAAALRRQTATGWGSPLVLSAGGLPISTHGCTPFGLAVDADDRVRVFYAARRDERRGLFARAVDGERLLAEQTVEAELGPHEFGSGAVLDAAGAHHVAYRLPDGRPAVSSVSRAGAVQRRIVDQGEFEGLGLYLGAGGPEALLGDARGGLVRVTLSGLFPWAREAVTLPGPAASGSFTLLRRPPAGVALALLRLARDAAGRLVLLGHALPAAALPVAPPAPSADVVPLGRWPEAVGASPIDPDARCLVEAGPALLALARVDARKGAMARVDLLRSDDRGQSWRQLEAPGAMEHPLYGALLPARDGQTVEVFVWGVDQGPAMLSRTYDVARGWGGPPRSVVLRDQPISANVTLDPRGEPVVAYTSAGGADRGVFVVRRRDGAFGHPARIGDSGTIHGLEVGPDEHVHVLRSAGAQGAVAVRYQRLDAALGPVLEEKIAEGVAGARSTLGLDGDGAALVATVEPSRLSLARWPTAPGAPTRVAAEYAFAQRARPRVALAFEADGPVVYAGGAPRLLRACPDADWTRLVVEELEVPGAREPLDGVAALRRPGSLVRGLVVVAGATGAEGGASLLARTVR